MLLGTLAVNAVGSLLMGIFIEVSALVWSPSPEMRAALTVGVLGGFTTFSAFSMEVIALVEQGAPLQAALYVAASVILSLAGVFGGMRLFRIVLT
ncbi:MAG: CrcB family protein [Kiloniellales bacterium]